VREGKYSEMIEGLFQAEDGISLDIIVHEPINPKACILIYPYIGGTTRLYTVPHEHLLSSNFVGVEYHPRSHGYDAIRITE
jgi:hypothetical protein